uniref:Gustatory receptor n=1 Tax=Tetranychus urticae TaxID=32264 RepID=T1JU81_TETUR
MSKTESLNTANEVISDGYLVPSKYILGPAIKIVLLLSVAYASTFQLSYHSISLVHTCRYSTKILIFQCLHEGLAVVNLLLFVLVVLFAFNMDHFRKFISTFQLLLLETDTLAVREIKRSRQIMRALVYGIVILFVVMFIRRETGSTNHTDSTFVFIVRCFHEVLVRFGSLFHLNMICNICFCLKAAFKQINLQINDLNTTTHRSVDHLFYKIRESRQKYSYAVRSTQSAEKLFRYYITIFYTEYFSYFTMNIVTLFGPKAGLDSIWFLYMFLDTFLFILLTHNLVEVNNLSREGLEDLYELSFKLNTGDSRHENDIFIARMALSDVGFTFANLFTINNSFITSLFTLSLTLIITLASFIYQ